MAISEPQSLDELDLTRECVDRRLAELVPEGSAGDPLNHSIRHSLLAPGKRLRPLMTILTVEALGASAHLALDPACAIEMVHTASLIVDDLPCMDDATLRRGRRSSHCRFGVATALLAAVSLLNRAPKVLAESPQLDDRLRLRLIGMLSSATGDVGGLAAGQSKDLRTRHGVTGLERLDEIVTEKTASLFICCTEAGAAIAGCDAGRAAALRRFAGSFGFCYQALDDLADISGSVEELRKDVGQDARKATLASLLGRERALEAARRQADAARAALREAGLADSPLARLAEAALAVRDN